MSNSIVAPDMIGQLRGRFLSDKSKVSTIVIFEYIKGSQATVAEIDLISTLMKQTNHHFFMSNPKLSDQQDIIAKRAYSSIKKSNSGNRKSTRNLTKKEYLPEDIERSDDDENVSVLLREEIGRTSETNASRSRVDMDWGIKSNRGKMINYDKLPKNDCRVFMGWDNGFDLVNNINPSALIRTYPTLMLDTRNRVRSDSDPSNRKTMTWNFYQGSRWAEGQVSGIGTIRDIVGIECGTIMFPNIEDQAYTEYGQVSMFIHEFSEQSSILSENVRFHFLFNAENVTGDAGTERLKLVSAFSDKAETCFGSPITTINTITISFGSPGERIVFPEDYDPNPGTITVSAAPGQPTSFTTSMIINTGILSNGDMVYLEGFTTGDVSADNTIIRLANREKGHVIQNVGSTSFEIAALDTSTATSTVSVNKIIFGSQRFFIPLKLRYMGGKRDDE